jgi:transglutaminase-like putative cysteine protease
VSRRSFRVDVAEPRPASAWALVGVASATLWITQQLAPWVIAVQVAFLLYTLAVRAHPRPWQQNPIALNVGMFFIVAVTIRVAIQGGPSTIALAHFTALTQALQLVDARPRRTEFLLVALALFQVVLASNLTDSVFFPPLLVAFVFATVWTLIVHTLRSEALEADERAAVTRALTPGLVKMTLFATGMSIVLALVLFVVLPRLRSSVVTGSNISPVIATAGFSNKVTLGELGRIRKDSTVVMRVETVDGQTPERAHAYWRGLAFDNFDGSSWSITPATRDPVPGSVEGGVTFGRHPEQFNLAQTIVREPVEAGVIFGIGDKRSLQGTVRRLKTDVNGGLYAARQSHERIRYTISTQRSEWRDTALRADIAVAPRWAGERYLQLPELAPAVEKLAREITRDAETDADRVRAIERYLLANGRYSDTPPSIDTSQGGSPLENFLFRNMAAHCEYFASALVVLARSVHLPARLVNGFAGGRRNRIGGFVEVTRSDAHAWAEVHFRRAGWVRYDATPPDLRVRATAPASFDEQIRELASALELWWFQSVVGFDRSDQIHAMKRAWLAWKEAQPGSDQKRATGTIFTRWQGLADAPWREGVVLLLCTGALGAVLWQLRPDPRHRGVPAAYTGALRLLERRGLRRDASTAARDFSASVRAAIPAAGPAFEALTETYLEKRFGGRSAASAPEQLKQLRERLREA